MCAGPPAGRSPTEQGKIHDPDPSRRGISVPSTQRPYDPCSSPDVPVIVQLIVSAVGGVIVLATIIGARRTQRPHWSVVFSGLWRYLAGMTFFISVMIGPAMFFMG